VPRLPTFDLYAELDVDPSADRAAIRCSCPSYRVTGKRALSTWLVWRLGGSGEGGGRA